MTKIYGVPLGRLTGTLQRLKFPERSAYRAGVGAFSDYTVQTWSSREAMARSIRMQERGAPRPGRWKPVLPLATNEGY